MKIISPGTREAVTAAHRYTLFASFQCLFADVHQATPKVAWLGSNFNVTAVRAD